MTNERSSAYGRVMKTLHDVGPAKLHDAERHIVRDAADVLLFSTAADDAEALEALAIVERLMADLAANERWTGESARKLADDIAACGPALALA
jgi:hypothetical protein